MDKILFENFPGPAAYLTIEGEILRVNDRLCTLWGAGRKDIIGRNLREFLAGGIFDSRVLETQRVGRYVYRYGEKEYDVLFIVVMDQVVQGNVTIYGLPLVKHNSSDLIEHLEVTKNLMDLLLHADVGILVVDERGLFVLLNKVAEQVLGLKAYDVIGLPIDSQIRDHRPIVLTAIEQKKILKELRARKNGEALCYFDITAVPLLNGSQVVGGLAFVTDITEKIILEKKLIDADRMTLVGEMAARIMHDIRNPLQVVKSSMEILNLWNNKGPMDSLRVRTVLDNVESAVNSVIELMNDMLQFSKPSTDAKEMINLQEMLTKMALMLDSSFRKCRIAFDLEVMTKCEIYGNHKLLHQAFLNIVQNAIEVLEDFEGERRLVIRSTEVGDTVYLEIFNTGPIIEEGIIDRIFDTFFSTKGTRGTGLGLAIAKDVVERAHGGKITCVSSVKNNGTSFLMELPKYFKDETTSLMT